MNPKRFNSCAIVASQKLGKLIRWDLGFVVVGVVLKRFGFIVDRHGDQNKQNGLEDFHDKLKAAFPLLLLRRRKRI